MINAENELWKDFKEALGKINFSSYNPNSADFCTALAIGKMWKLVHKLNESHDPETADVVNNDDISVKIADAKKYLQKYLSTDDNVYRQICTDELAHADALAKKRLQSETDPSEIQRLRKHEDEIKAVAGQI